MANRQSPVMFRLRPWITEILKEKGKGKFSPNLVAKHCILDHLLNLRLIPKNLLPQLIRDSKQDYFEEIQTSYKLTDAEMKHILELSESISRSPGEHR